MYEYNQNKITWSRVTDVYKALYTIPEIADINRKVDTLTEGKNPLESHLNGTSSIVEVDIPEFHRVKSLIY